MPTKQKSALLFRRRVKKRAIAPYDDLETTSKADSSIDQSQSIVANGWERHGIILPSLTPPVEWRHSNREFTFHLHAWEPLTILLRAISVTLDKQLAASLLAVSFAFAKDWLTHHQLPLLDLPPSRFGAANPSSEESFAWYDMAVGQRIYRLAFILDAICRDPNYSLTDIILFRRSLLFHHKLLADNAFFRSHSNHGLYQALGQIAASQRFQRVDSQMKRFHSLASRRLITLIEKHFTSEGVHKEHSPGYHYMILGSLLGARTTHLLPAQVEARVADMQNAMYWMIKPDATIVAFGDTDARNMTLTKAHSSRFDNHHLISALSSCTDDTISPHGVCCYAEAGYAFAKLKQRLPRNQSHTHTSSYLAHIAAFHSRVHKHADHLSFVWFDADRDILVDPGRYAYSGKTTPGSLLYSQGFWYSDPKRVYVESTHAHNTIEIDYKCFPRARTRPFGSALLFAREVDGCAEFVSKARYFQTILHQRRLFMVPHHCLIVLDWLYDRSRTQHTYNQHFQFAPTWTLSLTNSGAIAVNNEHNKRPATLTILPLLEDLCTVHMAAGQSEPRMQGWISDKPASLVPCPTLTFEIATNGMVIMPTIFLLCPDARIDYAKTRFSQSMSKGRIAWSDGHSRFTYEFHGHSPSSLTLDPI